MNFSDFITANYLHEPMRFIKYGRLSVAVVIGIFHNIIQICCLKIIRVQ